MSEDKMREEFEAHYRNRAPFEINGVGLYCDQSTQALWSGWKACASIKDAEIADLKTRLSGRTCFIPPEFQKQLDDAHAEIAARDLMIKELQEALMLFIGNPNFDGYPFMKGAEALAKSEHHNSRALEKMLLVARIEELNELGDMDLYPSARRYLENRLQEYKAKLAELNKE